ncbi:insulinase family protein [Patescibacteria group bacterium]|nr:insulinase family protein [Patescibacteria group bacterium]MBU4023154.1 insulinase family protein [Patescibacteria group bacterium]
MYNKTKLKNGLRIITVPDRNTQAITVLVLAKVGSKYEKKEINGISHFLEHMLFKGTKKRPTALSIAETLDMVGGSYNAFTSEEYTGYFAKVEKSRFDLALDWVSDIYLNSFLPEKELKKEKRVIIEEINMYLDNPMIYVQNLWKKLLYGDQPAGWDVAGTKKAVKEMSRKKLLDYRKSFYTSQNTLICVSGNFNEKEAIKKVKQSFSKIKKGRAVKKVAVIEKQSVPKRLIYFKKTDQTHLCLGVRAYNAFHPQKYALQILANILGGMMSSRLFVEIREKLGLAYYVSAQLDIDPDTGSLIIIAGIDNKKADKAIIAILKEFKKISEKKVSSIELKKAKDFIKGKMALSLETSDALASFYSGQQLLTGEILTTKEIFKEIDKVSEEDILSVTKDIFKPENLNLALIGPFKEKKQKERFDNLLKEF